MVSTGLNKFFSHSGLDWWTYRLFIMHKLWVIVMIQVDMTINRWKAVYMMILFPRSGEKFTKTEVEVHRFKCLALFLIWEISSWKDIFFGLLDYVSRNPDHLIRNSTLMALPFLADRLDGKGWTVKTRSGWVGFCVWAKMCTKRRMRVNCIRKLTL